MVGAILNGIVTSLDGAVTDVNWVLSGWAIAATVSVITVGKLSDIFGRRWMMLIGNVIALVGSVSILAISLSLSAILTTTQIVAASAQSLSTVIAGSTLIGFAFGFISLAFVAIPELCPFKYR